MRIYYTDFLDGGERETMFGLHICKRIDSRVLIRYFSQATRCSDSNLLFTTACNIIGIDVFKKCFELSKRQM